jgi:hypothetical protein
MKKRKIKFFEVHFRISLQSTAIALLFKKFNPERFYQRLNEEINFRSEKLFS